MHLELNRVNTPFTLKYRLLKRQCHFFSLQGCKWKSISDCKIFGTVTQIFLPKSKSIKKNICSTFIFIHVLDNSDLLLAHNQ